MTTQINRREFLEITTAGGALCLLGPRVLALSAAGRGPRLVSPGCRGTKVKIARLYLGKPGHEAWPRPDLDLRKEVQFYEFEFEKLKDELSDVDFVVDELVTSPEDVAALRERLKDVDGILAIQLTMKIEPALREILKVGNYTMVFAVPYSGHEWTRFGELMRDKLGTKLDCILTSDYRQLAAAIRPIRAIHHLREAKILDLIDRDDEWRRQFTEAVDDRFGVEIKRVGLKRVLDACEAVNEKAAQAETERWIKGATEAREPTREQILKSVKLALAFERLLDEENATVMTADCYGSMFEKLCLAYAFPCIGFSRLNNLGLCGMCESDLQSAVTNIIFQGLCGRPGFVNDPTVDESCNGIILAHCTAPTKMDGPDKPAAPYRLRSVMERGTGAVIHVKMRIGERATSAKLIHTNLMVYFTGEIIDTPDVDRGCRTKITVKVDGDVDKLWRNWSHGLHRVTCYGDIAKDLERFCRLKNIEIVNETV
jgi:hypothetical protein